VETFKNLNLPGALEKALQAMQFQKPTPIQARAIPLALSGKDIIASAQTGSGKTAAYCIPILARLLREPGKTALVLAPTRELALQIDAVWKNLARFSPGQSSAIVIGGTAMKPQLRALAKRPRLIVATPGRLLDHLRGRSARLGDVGVLVLDEADRMLDMGFAPQLSQILKHLPRERQTLLLSATWAPEMDRLAQAYLRNPVRVTVGPVSQAAPEVAQALVSTTPQKKNEALLDELNRRQGSILVFARTKSRTDRVAKYLLSYGVAVTRLHGGRTQGQRNAALSAFRSGQVRVLVATDIAARGIDISTIAHVVNYDLPQSSEDYVHRIGRTGRAGARGQAVSLITPEDRSQWREIARLLQKTGSRVPPNPAQDNLPAASQAPRETPPSPFQTPRRSGPRAPFPRKGSQARARHWSS
jgi:superfamily II DNA/RNA helicase